MPEKILLVDDDLDTLGLISLMLGQQGYQVYTAKDGAQGLSMAASEIPDMVLLDVMLPDIDGFEVARRLRADPLTAEIPIMMLTAMGQREDKVAGFEAGADAYLTKPIPPLELFAHVKAILSRRRMSRLANPGFINHEQ